MVLQEHLMDILKNPYALNFFFFFFSFRENYMIIF